MKERYQDYVIKDGKFIGKFEEMYQKFDDPWQQKETGNDSYIRHSTLYTLKLLKAKYVLEIGCGLGYFTRYMQDNLPNLQILGMDISETAINKAQKEFPELQFMTGNIVHCVPPCVFGGGAYDTLILSEIMWYILEDIDAVIKNIWSSGAKYLVINQTFYKGGQKYGVDFFSTPEEMVRFLPFKLLVSETVKIATKDSYDTHTVYEVVNK